MPSHPHAVASVESLRIAAARHQAALVRTLADEIERLMPSPAAAQAVTGQLVDELSRLGCRVLEAAAVLSELAEIAKLGARGVDG